jgi:hypothetical protein
MIRFGVISAHPAATPMRPMLPLGHQLEGIVLLFLQRVQHSTLLVDRPLCFCELTFNSTALLQ